MKSQLFDQISPKKSVNPSRLLAGIGELGYGISFGSHIPACYKLREPVAMSPFFLTAF